MGNILNAPEDQVSISLINSQAMLTYYHEGNYSDTSFALLKDKINTALDD